MVFRAAFAAIAAIAAIGAGQEALAEAGETASATIVATAEVLAPISLAHDGNASLSFGSIVLNGIGGTVNVNVAGGHGTTGSVLLIGARLPTRDSFIVTGEPRRTFTIMTANGVLGQNGGMAYTTLLGALTGTLDASGRASFLVGGELKIESHQPPGRYAGSYRVTVTYN